MTDRGLESEPKSAKACPACGGAEFNRLVAVCEGRSDPLLECSGCGLVRLEEMPDLSPSRQEVPAGYSVPALETYSRLLQWLNIHMIIRPEIRRFSRFLKGTGPILDIGCSTGWATALWRDYSGREAHGLEFNRERAEEAVRRYGLKVFVSGFEEAPLSEKSYQLVIFRHVLEHFIDPSAVMIKTHRILATGGHVLIIVPNGDSLGRRVFGRYWAWGPPQHIFDFSPRSLAAFLRRNGFRVRKVVHSPSPILLSYSVGNWLASNGFTGLSRLLHRGNLVLNTLLFPLALAGKLTGHGEVITVLAEKGSGEE